MLKFFFWILLLANGALLTYRQGYLDTMLPSGREPARMSNQFNADKVKLVATNAAPTASAAPAASVPPSAEKNAPPEAMVACTEIGNFNPEDAKEFEAKLAALALGERVSRRGVQETSSYIVHIPSQGDKEGADKKASELRRLGITDYYVMHDNNSSMRWAISLGVFRTEEAARTHLAGLSQKGVRTARISPRITTTNLAAFQLRDINAGQKSEVEKIKADFPKQEIRACAPG